MNEYDRAVSAAILLVAGAILIALWRRDLIRPGSFDRGTPPRPTPPIGVSWMYLAGALTVLMLGVVLAAGVVRGVDALIAGAASDIGDFGRSSLEMFFATVALAMLALTVWAGLWRVSPDRRASADARDATLPAIMTRSIRLLLLAIPLTLATGFVFTWLHALITGDTPDPLAHETLRMMASDPYSRWWWLTVATVLVLAPIYEEALYRGLLQTSFLALFAGATRSDSPERATSAGRWIAIGLTSAIFAAAHTSAVKESWYALPSLFVLSVVLGVAYERARGRWALLSPVLVHAGFNAVNIGLALYAA